VEGFKLLIEFINQKNSTGGKRSNSVITRSLPVNRMSVDMTPHLSQRCLDEFLQMMNRGIPVVKHIVHSTSVFGNDYQKKPRLLWIRNGRVCVDHQWRIDSKGAKGCQIDDVSQVRRGASSYVFEQGQLDPMDGRKCMTIVASERTIDIELNMSSIRDKIVNGLRHLVNESRKTSKDLTKS